MTIVIDDYGTNRIPKSSKFAKLFWAFFRGGKGVSRAQSFLFLFPNARAVPSPLSFVRVGTSADVFFRFGFPFSLAHHRTLLRKPPTTLIIVGLVSVVIRQKIRE